MDTCEHLLTRCACGTANEAARLGADRNRGLTGKNLDRSMISLYSLKTHWQQNHDELRCTVAYDVGRIQKKVCDAHCATTLGSHPTRCVS